MAAHHSLRHGPGRRHGRCDRECLVRRTPGAFLQVQRCAVTVGGKSISTTEQKLGAVSLQSSCYGTCIPIGYGKTRASPNLVYYTDFKAIPHTTTSGGKGGGKTKDTTFTYSATIILAVGEG